jgi:hypothetical protein
VLWKRAIEKAHDVVMKKDATGYILCGYPWVRWLLGALVALLLAVIGVGGWIIYTGVSASLEAEKNLHATLFAVHLVERFISEQGRWPRSWSELEGVSMREGLLGEEWPAISPMIQRRVSIDFTVDPLEVAGQDPMSFIAIRPIGPKYEYRDYGDVPSLQRTIRKSIGGAAGQ